MFIPSSVKEKVTAILIFTDPAALGLFFLGAMILLEKSECVLASLAVSPIKTWEYIVSKVLSLSIISTSTAIIISAVYSIHILPFVVAGAFLGSVLFSLFGIIIGTKAKSLNQFLILTVPITLVIMLPALAETFGVSCPLFWINPGNAVLRVIEGNVTLIYLSLSIIIACIIVAYAFTIKAVSKMLKTIGGVKL
jgi:fluoroquinolone transport system permease protein